MSRLVVFALVASLGNTSVAFADGLLDSGKRIARDAARETAVVASPAQASPALAARTSTPHFAAPPTFAQSAQSAPAVSTSGASKKTKAMIMIGAAVAFIGTIYAIDHQVQDITPSSLGTRED